MKLPSHLYASCSNSHSHTHSNQCLSCHGYDRLDIHDDYSALQQQDNEWDNDNNGDRLCNADWKFSSIR